MPVDIAGQSHPLEKLFAIWSSSEVFREVPISEHAKDAAFQKRDRSNDSRMIQPFEEHVLHNDVLVSPTFGFHYFVVNIHSPKLVQFCTILIQNSVPNHNRAVRRAYIEDHGIAFMVKPGHISNLQVLLNKK